MRRILGLFAMSIFVAACADQDAEIERAKYLLGKGGVANAREANSILEPLTVEGRTSGERRLEVVKLYVGAQLGIAGFDSIKIIAALLYNEDGRLLRAISDACEGVTNESRTNISAARSALRTVISSDDFAAASERTQAGLYFQDALVDVLDALRILVTLSGLSDGDVSACTTALDDEEVDPKDTDGTPEKQRHEYANTMLNYALTTLQSATQGRLSSTNEVVEAIREMEEATGDLTSACNHITSNLPD